MNETLLTALEEISDRHIREAADYRHRKTRIWVRSLAAVLAVVVLLALFRPADPAVSAGELVTPAVYTPPERPREEDYRDRDTYSAARDAYWAEQNSRQEQNRAVMERLSGFWADAFREFLDEDANSLWSPVNSYLSLAVTAQISSGGTRQEILDALNTQSMDTLLDDAQRIWEQVWAENEETQRHLASSLWLDGSLAYQSENLEILGQRLYTSVHQTDLNAPEGSEDIRAWIDSQTGGTLGGDAPAGSAGHGNRVLSLASAAYVNDTWFETFDPERSHTGSFHAPGGDVDCTFMNADMDTTDYARGENYTAVALPSNGGCRFWMILPDEGTSVAELLESGAYLDTVFDPEPEDRKVILTMPKFDITATTDLKDGLKNLGIQKAFSFTGDFSETVSGGLGPVCVADASQTARIIVNETGIRAGSGEVRNLISASAVQPLRITFDRPFLFVLMLDSIPLYAGVVAEP